ncbi:MAG: TonB-dependent receptor [Gammaproteobacteria bacterium]|nr:MAG: TonB-dependent receptor [Gammaproteobacteria bacterium]
MRIAKRLQTLSIGCVTGLVLASPVLHAQDDPLMEEVTVTGIRGSLGRALELKRESANAVENIVAEDIGKMPDLNLAESLQRVPGVAITREGGEGRNITVRGLGPGFTRTTLNGMEVPSSTGGLDSSGGVNRGRDFDFNVFASELFNRITINKSTTASIEEGGLASTVDLYTPRPFDAPGFRLVAGAQAALDNLSGETDPRVVALISNTFADDRVGVLLSVAQSTRTVRQEGFGTVRWTSPWDNGGRSWVGEDDDVVINGTPHPELNYPDVDPAAEGRADQLLDFMWHPRLPRMDSFNRDQDRLGITAALQFRPSDALELTLDYVKSELEADVISYNYFAQFRNSQNNIQPIEVTLDPSGRYITAGTFDNVFPRSESRGQFGTTDFQQIAFSGRYTFAEGAYLDLLIGQAESDHHEQQYRFNLTAVNPHRFSYSFAANPNIAEMSYDFDLTDYTEYTFTGPVLRDERVLRENQTVKLDLTLEEGPSSLKTGLAFNDRSVDSAFGTPAAVDTPPAPDATLTNAFSEVIDDFGEGIDAPAGFPRDWLVADFDATIEAYRPDTAAGFDFQVDPLNGNTFYVEEETAAWYAQVDSETELLGRPLRVNAGVRVVRTETTARGAVEDSDTGEITPVVGKNDYTDVLPSTNLVWVLQDDLQLRLNLARNMTRPGLASLVPTVTDITPLAGTLSAGNPRLDPIRANSADLGIEWYFAEDALLALTYFHKDIESFITSDSVTGPLSPELQQAVLAADGDRYDPSSPTYDPNLVPVTGADWTVSTSVNGEGATLDGWELAYQHPFSFLPKPWDGFGIVANYTHVESMANYGNGVRSPLEGLSENSYNFTLYYENDRFGARASVNSRDDYITDATGDNGNAQHATTGPTRIDLSAYWNVTEALKLTLEVINLDNEPERLYTTGPRGDLNLVREYNTTGREVYLGLRWSLD